MTIGMIGRKVGMMRLYDGAGRVHGVTVIEVGANVVTQLRTEDRDGYQAVQIGSPGPRKRLTRPERGHLRAAGADRGVDGQALSTLREFRVDDTSEFEVGQRLGVDLFQPGSFVNVRGTSKGRGFAGGVRRWNFRGGPKTHGQSDRWRAPGSIGAGTTPGRVWKGQKMAGHMGARTSTVTNLLVVTTDPSRQLIFVEGSVPGPRNGIVTIAPGRRAPLEDFEAPEVTPAGVAEVEQPAVPEDTVPVEEAVEAETTEGEAAEAAASETEAPEATTAEAEAPEAAAETEAPEAEAEPAAEAEEPAADETNADETGADKADDDTEKGGA